MLLAFDYDGVIADSIEQLLSLTVDVQKQINVGRVPTKEDFGALESLTFEDLAVLIGIPDEKISFFTEAVFALQAKITDVNIFPGIRSVFEKLSQHNTLVVISNSQTETVTRTLKSFGLSPTISAVLGSDLGLSKAERIAKVRKAFGARTDETFMIGDAISDIREGKLAKVSTIGVTWGFQPQHLLEVERPDFIVNAPIELLDTIAIHQQSHGHILN